MEPERWRRITALFEAAQELSAGARDELFARVDPADRAEVESLLAHAEGDSIDGVREAVVAAARDLLPGDGPLTSGRRLGRYVLLDRLGAGGMGVVYAAWDPELDRKVAIKLLHRRDEGGANPLLAEARALARLAHPNVLAIHDVGTIDGQVFLAMEFVDGMTLRQWCAAPRTWREVLAVLLAAGEGLAAAHAAGLIHRDFKPENVMVARDGRVRVMDFGLARAGRGPPAGPCPATSHTAAAGTPAYMAPEQWEDGPLDARTDVFAFCVTAWESFHGQRPFDDDTTPTTQALDEGRVRAPRGRTHLPRRIHRVLLRGLRLDPDARYSDMGALLAELRRDPRVRLLRAAWVLLAALAVFGLADAAHRLTRPGHVFVRLTGRGAPLVARSVEVGPHALAVVDGVAQGDVPAGTYRLVARADDHAVREAVVEVERGRAVHLDLELQHEQGRLDLEVEPPGSTIYVDGVDHGARLRGLSVDTGAHRLRARSPGHYDAELEWTVAADETRAGWVSLSRGLVWSRQDTGLQRLFAGVGDVDGDGRLDLLHRRYGALVAISPWDDRTIASVSADPKVPSASFLGARDGGELLVAVATFGEQGAVRLDMFGDLRDGPLWTRRGAMRRTLFSTEELSWMIDVDGDRSDDLVTPFLEPRTLTACDGRTGRVLWRTPLGAEILGVVPAAAVAGPRLLVVTETGRHALDSRTGAPVWSSPAPPRQLHQLHALARDPGASPLFVVMTEDAGAGASEIEVLDADRGGLLWSRGFAHGRDPRQRSLAVGSDRGGARVVFGSDERTLAIDAETGAEAWRSDRAGNLMLLAREPGGPDWMVAIGVDPGCSFFRLADGAHLFDVDLGGAAFVAPARLDWDGDGTHELAFAGGDGTIALFGRGGAREGSIYLPDVSPLALSSAGDLDADGFEDLAIQGAGGPALVLAPKVLWSRRAQDALRAAPVVADLDADGRLEVVVVGIFDGARGLHAFDARTGARKWPAVHQVAADVLRAPAVEPRPDGGVDLLIRDSEALERFDGRTGAVRVLSRLPLGYAGPGLVDLAGDGAPWALLTPWEAGPLLALDPDSGAPRWSAPLPAGGWTAPAVGREGGRTLLALHLLDGRLLVLDADTRATRWTRPFGQVPYVPPTLADLDGDGALELVASQVGEPGDLVCLRLSDGEELWRLPGLAGRSAAVAAVDLDGDGDRELIHTSNGSGVLALDHRGERLWQYRPRPALATQPLSDGGGLVADLDGDGAPEYVTALRDGVVHVLDARTGALRWRFHADARIEAPPVAADVDGDGVQELVVAGYDRVLRVLRTPPARPRP